jgi:SPP1 gp7 family putative phage head morphogenesis protein
MSDPVQRVLDRGAARVTRINATTRDAIQSAIATAIEQGISLLDLADAIEQGGGDISIPGLDAVYTDYRAEMIARTELMDAYNAATLGSYEDAGITRVEAIDGDDDDECAARNGQEFSVDEADSIEDHPNGTLDWIPVLA